MLPDTYSELYPGRFLKSDLLKGRKVTLTIKNIDVEELIGDKGKADPKVVASFVERPLELVLPKTNGFCLKRMFGDNPHSWIGKRVTLFPSQTKFGRETVDCIRIWGSPDIAEDMEITVPQGRKKPLEMVMHKTPVRTSAQQTVALAATTTHPPVACTNPRMLEIFEFLGWNEDARNGWLEANKELPESDQVSKLEAELDK